MTAPAAASAPTARSRASRSSRLIGSSEVSSTVVTGRPSSDTVAGSPSRVRAAIGRRAGHRPQQRHQVLAAARQRPVCSIFADSPSGAGGYRPVVGDEPGEGLWPKTPQKNAGMRIDPAMSRGHPEHRSARIRPPRPHRRRSRPAVRLGVIRVAGAAVEPVARLDPQRQLGGVGHAERDRAGVDQALHRRRALDRRGLPRAPPGRPSAASRAARPTP